MAGWPLFSRLLREGIEAGAADLDGDGVISVAELCEYAGNLIQPLNAKALTLRSSGEPAAIIPTPRVLPEGCPLLLASRVTSTESSTPS